MYFTEYFSPEEYKLGDIIIFKNIELNTSNTINKLSFLNFINRDGHTIIGHAGTVGSHGLYNRIQIPLDYTINKQTGTTSSDTFDCVNDEQHNVSSGYIINKSLQVSIYLSINTL